MTIVLIFVTSFFLYRAPARLFFRLFVFRCKHFLLGAAGSPALLATDFLLRLALLTFDADPFFFDPIAEIPPGKKTVGCLQARLLTSDFDAGGRMAQLHAGRRFIDFLPALAGTADKLLGEIGLADPERRHPLIQFFPFFLRNHADS